MRRATYYLRIVLSWSIWAGLLLSAGPSHGQTMFSRWPDSQRPAPRQRSARPHPAVVRVSVPDRTGVSQGSGTLVGLAGQYGLVITNWHVVRDAAGDPTVQFPDGFRSAARIAKVDSDWDLAALVIWRPRVEPVRLAQSAPRPGDVLTIAGYGSGTYRAATGRCTQYVAPGVNFPYEMVEVSAQAREGDSGGPIFNQRGELAGVLFGASRGVTSGSYAGRVHRFLDTVETALKKQDHPVMANAPPAPQQEESRQLAEVPSLTGSDLPVATPPAPRFQAKLASTPIDLSAAESDSQPSTGRWQSLAGETPLEQAKSVLAVFGLLSILMLLMRRLSN